MVDERQRKAIELLVEGGHSKSNIAKIVGVSRQTLYNWLDDEKFNTALDKRYTEIKTQAERELNAKLPKAIDEYWKLAMTTTDARTKQIALSYVIDRCLGKPTSRTEMTNGREDKDSIPKDVLEDILDDDDDNIIDINEAK